MKTNPYVPSFFKRFGARAVDYSIFYTVITILLPLLGIHLDFYQRITMALITPMLFVPIETLLNHFFGSTIGNSFCYFKHVCEYKKPEKVPFLTAFKKAFITGLKITSIVYPLFSLVWEDKSKRAAKKQVFIDLIRKILQISS